MASPKSKILRNMKLIGAGGFGNVYEVDENTVVKAIVDSVKCNDSKVEIDTQYKIYRLFEYLRSQQLEKSLETLNLSDSDLEFINFAKNSIMVSKPHNKKVEGGIVNGLSYSCLFYMEKLRGIPMDVYNEYLPKKILKRLDKDWLEKMGENYEMMTHLTFNSNIKENFYGVKYGNGKIDDVNPPRGLFIEEDSHFLFSLIKDYDFASIENLVKMVGFIYGWIFYKGGIVPIDIEICLGLYEDKLMINVLDFGMTSTVKDIAEDRLPTNDPRTMVIINEVQKLSGKMKMGDIIERIAIDAISIDIYCDIEDVDYSEEVYMYNKQARDGWDLAKTLTKDLFLKKRGFMGES